jgi:hypothetical protein
MDGFIAKDFETEAELLYSYTAFTFIFWAYASLVLAC